MKPIICLLVTFAMALAIQTPKSNTTESPAKEWKKSDYKLKRAAPFQKANRESELQKPDHKLKREAALEDGSAFFGPSTKYYSSSQNKGQSSPRSQSNYYHVSSTLEGFRASPSDNSQSKMGTYIIKTESGPDGKTSVVYKVYASDANAVINTFHNGQIKPTYTNEYSKNGKLSNAHLRSGGSKYTYSTYEPATESPIQPNYNYNYNELLRTPMVDSDIDLSNQPTFATSDKGQVQLVVIPYQNTPAGQMMLEKFALQNAEAMPSYMNDPIQYFNEAYNNRAGPYQRFGPSNNYMYNQPDETKSYKDMLLPEPTTQNHDGDSMTMLSHDKGPSYGYGGQNGDLSASLDALATSFGKMGGDAFVNSHNFDFSTATVTHVAPRYQQLDSPSYAQGHKGLMHFGTTAFPFQQLHTDAIESDKYNGLRANFKPSAFLGAIAEGVHVHGEEPESTNYDFPTSSPALPTEDYITPPTYDMPYSTDDQAPNHRYLAGRH